MLLLLLLLVIVVFFFVVVKKKSSLLFCFRNPLLNLICLFKADINPVYRVVYKHKKSQWNLALCQDTQLTCSVSHLGERYSMYGMCAWMPLKLTALHSARVQQHSCIGVPLPTIVGHNGAAAFLLPVSVHLQAVDVWRSGVSIERCGVHKP